MNSGRENGLLCRRRVRRWAPFAFTGRIKRVVFDVNPHVTEDEKHGPHEQAEQALTAHGITE